MDITQIRIQKVDQEGKLKAYASVTFDNVFVIHNIKLIEGRSGNVFVAMPNRKTKSDEYKDIAHPISDSFRQGLLDAVLTRYEEDE